MHKIIVCVTILVTSVTSAFCGEPDKVLHQKCLYPTVMVMNEAPKGVGTGVIVKIIKKEGYYENYVFTCAHVMMPVPVLVPQEEAPPPPADAEAAPASLVVKPAKEKYEINIRVGIYENWSTLVGYKNYPGEVLFVDRDKDVGLVKFESESQNSAAELDKELKLYIGNDVLKIGCGLSEPFRIDSGKITSINKSIGNMIKDTYRVSAPTIMGDSGGPVYHENKLIGLSQAVRNCPASSPFPVSVAVPHMAYVLPIRRFYDCEKIMEYLKD